MHDTNRKLPTQKINLLLVDDDEQISKLLTIILSESGYKVRAATDGITALLAIRDQVPDIILCDLNMPSMSGFELLSVIRRRLPAIKVVAMSGAFCGNDIPEGVAADCFYEKGRNIRTLLEIIATMTGAEEMTRTNLISLLTPIWIPTNGHDLSGEAHVMIACPECLRTFRHLLHSGSELVSKVGCVSCFNSIYYAIVQPWDPASPQIYQKPKLHQATPKAEPAATQTCQS
jgi:CheY-like chemotaxis protein